MPLRTIPGWEYQCAADNKRDDVSMDEEISAVEDGVVAMAEEIEKRMQQLEQ